MKIEYWEKLEPNAVYHIYNRAIGKDNLFAEDNNYQYFLGKWKKYLPYLDVFAYCLMPNHFHFLARVKDLSEPLMNHAREQGTVKSQQLLVREISYSEYLEDQFKRLLSSYALAFNKQQGRHGSLFQKSFKRVLILDEYKLHYLLTYIHHNPIHHHFVHFYGDWKYSSWSAFQNMNQPSLLNRTEVLGWFDEDFEKARTRFISYHEQFRIDHKMKDFTLEND